MTRLAALWLCAVTLGCTVVYASDQLDGWALAGVAVVLALVPVSVSVSDWLREGRE